MYMYINKISYTFKILHYIILYVTYISIFDIYINNIYIIYFIFRYIYIVSILCIYFYLTQWIPLPKNKVELFCWLGLHTALETLYNQLIF